MIDAIAAAQSNQNPRTENLARQADKSGSYMQMEDFLQLLTSQISNQDPLEPMKDTEFISQMANIASLEQMQQFTQGFESFADSQKDMVAQAIWDEWCQFQSKARKFLVWSSRLRNPRTGRFRSLFPVRIMIRKA